MKKNYILKTLICLTLSTMQAQQVTDDGVVVATENFDAVTAPTPASDYFTFDTFSMGEITSEDFKNSIAFSSSADVSGTGQGVSFMYDANLFNPEDITLHTFTDVLSGDYIIQYDINVENAGVQFEALISDGTNTVVQSPGVFVKNGEFRKRYTAQISITEMSNLSFTMQMSPFTTGFFTSQIFIDNIELVKMNEALETVVEDTVVVQEEIFDTASTPPVSNGAQRFIDNVVLSSDSDIDETEQGVEFMYTAFYGEVVNDIEVVTFTTVPAGTYYIDYQFNDGNNNSNSDFTYYNQILSDTSVSSNYIVTSMNSEFSTHRTYSITIDETSDISLKLIFAEEANNVTFGTPNYLDNVRLLKIEEDTTTLNNQQVVNTDVRILPNPTDGFIKTIGLKHAENYVIYNSAGLVVKTGIVSDAEVIGVSGFKNGLYILKLHNQASVKFVR